MAAPLELSIVRIYSNGNKGKVIGAGFLVSQKYILTCAHVIANALGLSRTTAQMPDAEITLDFPLVAAKQLFQAKVVFWLPVNPDMAVEDIAGLELKHSAPDQALVAPLITSDDWAGHPFRVLGFPGGQPDGVWATGVLRGRTAKGWVQLEDVKQPGYKLEPGFSGAPIWDGELQGIAGIAVAVDINRPEAKVGFMIPTQMLVSAWSVLREQAIAIASCPYRGLFPFREEDTRFFFGRDIFTQKLVDTVQKQSLVAVIGASGSGKSSVVFAGLIPHLRQQNNWIIESFRPKTHPVDELAAVIVRLRDPEKGKTQQDIYAGDLARGLRVGQLAAHTVLSRILSENEDKRLLLVVDQLEELYTSCSDVKERQLFLNQLLEAAKLVQNFTLLLTLRADFLGYALSDPLFADALQNPDLKLAPMNQQELQQAIAQPANKQGVRLEEGLAERILRAVADSPGNLPLLEFTLTQLWAQQQNRQLTHAAYEAIGGVEKSLANHAEAEFAKLKPKEQEQAQQIFVQLVRPGEGTEDTRRLATRNEVGDNWDLVKRLADARLVVTGLNDTAGKKQEIVEIVHETLIREWGRLHGWMESDRSFRTWQELLRTRMRQWENAGQDKESLLRGVPLAEAENWLKQRREELSQAEQDFIQQSLALRDRDQQQKERRRNLTVFGLIGVLVIVSILAVVAFLRWTAEVEGSGVTALRNFESDGGEIGALVSAMEAGQEVNKMAFWNLEGKLIRQFKAYQGGVNSVRFSPIETEDLIVTGGKDGTIKLWTRTGKSLKPFKPFERDFQAIRSINFNNKGDELVTGGDDGIVKLWDLKGSKLQQFPLPHKGKVKASRFSPDGKLIAIVRENGTALLWNPNSKTTEELLGHQGYVNSVGFSPKDKKLATAGDDGTVRLWDYSGKQLKEFKTYEGRVTQISFSRDGKLLSTSSANYTTRLWNLSGQQVAEFTGHQGNINSADFSPDGKLLATASEDKTAIVWRIRGLDELLHEGCDRLKDYLVTNPDEKKKLSICP
ncbi:nSTAND1 domain-containing NTPase [Nostoc sp.]|uniref:nSTAND1 domain-containing NTPase n=1 Tax=Nostoc sp. TaxID=1180 RepID=UPI002FFA0359